MKSICLINDYYGIYKGDADVEVNELNDVILARAEIEKWKLGARIGLKIINRDRHCELIFRDLHAFGPGLQIESISPLKVLTSRVGLDVDLEVSDTQILELGLIDNLDKFRDILAISNKICCSDSKVAFWRSVMAFITGGECFLYIGIDDSKAFDCLFRLKGDILKGSANILRFPFLVARFRDIVSGIQDAFAKKFWTYFIDALDEEFAYQYCNEVKLLCYLANYSSLARDAVLKEIDQGYLIPKSKWAQDFSAENLFSLTEIRENLGEILASAYPFEDNGFCSEINRAVSAILSKYFESVYEASKGDVVLLAQQVSGYFMCELEHLSNIAYKQSWMETKRII